MSDLILFVAATAVGTLIAGLVLEHFGRLRNVLEIPVLVAHGTRVVSSAMWQRLLALRYLRLRIDRPASDDATGETLPNLSELVQDGFLWRVTSEGLDFTVEVSPYCPAHLTGVGYQPVPRFGGTSPVERIASDQIDNPYQGRFWCDGSGASDDHKIDAPAGQRYGEMRRRAEAIISGRRRRAVSLPKEEPR